ncbi:hypothetical protein NL676_008637 [Syzygium grande]|nr:hypothetical protein NL676_008637 [Syzygium grande]
MEEGESEGGGPPPARSVDPRPAIAPCWPSPLTTAIARLSISTVASLSLHQHCRYTGSSRINFTVNSDPYVFTLNMFLSFIYHVLSIWFINQHPFPILTTARGPVTRCLGKAMVMFDYMPAIVTTAVDTALSLGGAKVRRWCSHDHAVVQLLRRASGYRPGLHQRGIDRAHVKRWEGQGRLVDISPSIPAHSTDFPGNIK